MTIGLLISVMITNSQAGFTGHLLQLVCIIPMTITLHIITVAQSAETICPSTSSSTEILWNFAAENAGSQGLPWKLFFCLCWTSRNTVAAHMYQHNQFLNGLGDVQGPVQ